MESTEIAPGIVVYQNVIDEYSCLIEDIENAVKLNVLSWADAGVHSEDSVSINKNIRDTKTMGIRYIDSFNEKDSIKITLRDSIEENLSKLFFTYFNPCEIDYQSKFLFNTEWHDSYGILKYGLGQKFTNHIDDNKDYHRRMSTVYYLNDDYSGGEINFPRFSITYKPKANELLIFPSGYVYNHSVSEVIDGTRYAVVSWLK